MKEYKVISLHQEISSLVRWDNRFDPEKMEQQLNQLAALGWHLSSALSAQNRGTENWQCLLIMERDSDSL
jgi:hypothetical protein